MIELYLLANLQQPSNLTCQQVREVAEVVMEDPYLSDGQKNKVLSNLFGKHMRVSCFRKFK